MRLTVPERSETRFCWSPSLKLNRDTYCREFTSRFAQCDHILVARDLLQTVLAGSSPARLWST